MSIDSFSEKHSLKQRTWLSTHECAVCGSKAIGTNFGAPTCAPCKGNFEFNSK